VEAGRISSPTVSDVVSQESRSDGNVEKVLFHARLVWIYEDYFQYSICSVVARRRETRGRGK